MWKKILKFVAEALLKQAGEQILRQPPTEPHSPVVGVVEKTDGE